MSNQEPFRIPKRTASDPNQSGSQGSCVRPNQEGNVKKEESVNSAPRRMFTLPSSSSTSGAQVFNPIGKCQVQTNSFKIDITKMPKRLLRLSMETRLCGGKTELNLNDGVQAVAGNLNSQEDFTTQEWSQISNYLRKKNAEFKVKISPNGFVYTNGPNSLSDANRQELPRLVEIATSEVLNTPEYLQFGNQTYAVNEPAVSSPDALSEIRSGFDKSVILVDGENGSTEIIMTIDNKLAPFHKSTSVLKMTCDKFEEIVNPARQHRGSQDRRGDRDRGYRGGRSYGHDNRRRSRSRSPQDRGDAMKQNVRSGTCLDGKITSAGREEFVLISQTALIGTAKPTKYTIAANDPKWSKNEVMNLTYILSFAHQVCYQPPAVPHILYAADNLAKRGRNNFIQHKKLGELSKTIQATLTKYSDLNIEMDSKELSGELVEDITKSMNVMAIKARNFWA